MDARRKNENPDWLGGSAVAENIRARDWSRTPLGPLDSWPACLRTTLSICLHSLSPVAVYWGPDLITLYNDVCGRFLGDSHPRALGMPAADLFREIWPSVGPLLVTTFTQGVATGARNQPVPLKHQGRDEELRFDFTANPIHGERGEVVGVMVIAIDISDHIRTASALAAEMAELQRLQSQQRVLVAELQHRTRNLLAVIRSIASHSFSQIADTGQLDAFFERLSSLGRVQGLISRAEGERVNLSEIVWAELEAYAYGTRSHLEVHGPTVRLLGHQVQVLALALHELATNAVKYGALHTPKGKLSITWETWLGAQGRPRLALLWMESGVQMPPRPTVRRGQGRELIENALRFSLNAETQLVFGDDGVWCRIELPLDRGGGAVLDPARPESRSE
ncbi:MAG: HWE histidine kinase domain-containing protein [Gammaproteobacteria bacterium]